MITIPISIIMICVLFFLIGGFLSLIITGIIFGPGSDFPLKTWAIMAFIIALCLIGTHYNFILWS